jgi:cytochrome P450
MSATMTPFESFDVTSAEHKAKAHEVYAGLREKTPLCRVRLPTKEEAYLVLRYADVSAMLKDQRFAKDPANALSPSQLKRIPNPPKMFRPLTRNMLGMDDPDHARLKKLVQAGFTPRRMEMLAARTEMITEEILSRIDTSQSFDLVSSFAMPMPITIISELLGVPKKDQAKFARWSHTLLSVNPTSWRMVLALPDILRFLRYLKYLIALKRKSPADDLVSALVQIEAGGDRLSSDELMAMIAILLSAGHETTSNLIANGTLALLQNRNAFEHLREQPELIDTAVEELLRFAGPVETSTFRYAREDIDIAGHIIPHGALVLGVINSANRDERQFPSGNTLDLARSPNRHLTFGEGGHYCVGAALARMEARIAFTAMLMRWPNLRLSRNFTEAEWKPGMVLRGLKRLPLEIN